MFTSQYPSDWSLGKCFTIFKKGARLAPGNYRGICVLGALAKLYDTVLAARFSLWYKPKEEQAGASPGRGCEEQILAVRLLIDIARRTKQELYIAFIDYEKAYDKVNRGKLAMRLAQMGCGNTYMKALLNTLHGSTGVIGKEQFRASSGVRQGGASSCPVSTFFIDPTIEAISSTGPDGWLEGVHCVLLMDDTVVFSTSREKLAEKLGKLKQCTDGHDHSPK